MNSVNACLDKCINAELLLSIIVPVFNVQDYVEQCLLSIVDKRENDELSKVEIIVIDDGSTDNSRSVIEKLISKFPVIKLFTKQNGGLSDARNFGLNRASGKYIAFIDSDDIVDNEFIKIVLKCIENYSFDVLSFDFEKFYTKPRKNKNTKLDELSIKNVGLDFYEDKAIFAWNKIYNRELFIDEKFIKGLYYEDVALIPILLSNAKKRIHLFQTCYYYRQRFGSITFCKDNKYLDILKGLKFVRSKSKNEYIDSFTINQFFTLCLVSLRLPTMDYYSNMSMIIQYYMSNFEINTLNPKFKFKHFPFWVLKKIGENAIHILFLLKPIVLLHQALKITWGKKNAKI